jgi:exodeoxyribonuclease VII small subunit
MVEAPLMAKAKDTTADPSPAKEESFEASAERLADIVKRLEGGDLPLEDSLRLFEEGIQVARAAQARLEAAERRVDELLGVDDQGRPLTRPFE